MTGPIGGERGVRGRWLLVAAVLVVPACGGSAGGSDGSSAKGASPRAPVERLPDLLQRSPDGLTGATARTPKGPRFRLAFASAVDNVGEGALIVDARRRAGRSTMVADQLVRRSDGSFRRVGGVGRLRYTVSSTHRHWHYLRFDRYTLRRIGAGAAVRRDRKTGFCLGDRYELDAAVRLLGEPEAPVWTEECGRDRPQLVRLQEGISVGYGDNYHPLLEGQFLDITGLPAGRYELVHHVNADRVLVEADYANNAASIILALSWPRGKARPPQISVIQRCGHGRRCTGG